MECAETAWLSTGEYLSQFHAKAAKLHIPLTGSLDLTYRCNLKCIHCYLGGSHLTAPRKEMDTRKVLSLLDEITEAGCLHLLITGGEPLLRKDFPEVYRHAKQNGLIITIFTNGTLITDPILELFDDLPPQAIEISLYGATLTSYEKITHTPGSYEKCLEGIRRLLNHRLNLSLKTILMSLNTHELFDMEHMAREWGIKFRFDPSLFPRFNGERTPLDLRIPPEEAVEKEFSDPTRAGNWKKYFEETKGSIWSDNLYHCGAGVTSFHIDPYGFLKPCLMSDNFSYNLSGGSFLKGWEEVIPRISDMKPDAAYSCNGCEKRYLCDLCPAFFKWENGAEHIRSEYLCAIGNRRFQKVHNRL
jgi:radical SAM protein with 4Fe4S-binding SPASM domain